MFKHVPNILSTFRLILVPVFAIVFFSDMANANYVALGIFILAGITDVLDGYIARHYNLISKVGTVLDPLADKLMQLTALVCLTIDGALPLWIMVILLAKEAAMIVTGIYMYFRKKSTVIPSNWFGKSATILFSLAILVTILYPDSIASLVLVIGALVLKLTALATYIHKYFTKMKPTFRAWFFFSI